MRIKTSHCLQHKCFISEASKTNIKNKACILSNISKTILTHKFHNWSTVKTLWKPDIVFITDTDYPTYQTLGLIQTATTNYVDFCEQFLRNSGGKIVVLTKLIELGLMNSGFKMKILST